MRLAVLLLVFLSRVAGAYLQSGLPLEQLTASSDVIVKVAVSDVRPLELHPESPRFAMAATIVAVMKQDGYAIPEQQVFEAFGLDTFDPDLRADGADKPSLLLFLMRDASGRLQIIHDRHAILPVYAASAGVPVTPASVPRGLFDELYAVASRHSDPLVRAKYIALMAAFATHADTRVFEQLTTSEDPWVRLASALATARIDLQPSRMEAVVRAMALQPAQWRDAKSGLFDDVFSDVAHVARCRAFGMDDAMALRARAYLPVYRYLLDLAEGTCLHKPIACRGVGMGVEALAAVGTEEDLLRLWRFCRSTWAPARHDALEGLARILGYATQRPEMRAYDAGEALPDAVLAWEAHTISELEPLLRARGLLG
jgi:hypothetical protein